MGTVGATLARPAQTPERRQRWRPPAGLWFPVAAFALTRLFGAAALLVGARSQPALDSHAWAPRVGKDATYFVYKDSPASPDYWTVLTNWDGQWYWKIATEGLHSGPGSTPVDLWAWAFGPVFPFTVSGVMHLTGLSFPVAATVVNVLFGLVGVLLLWDLVRRVAGVLWAACAVALFLALPPGVLLQAAYSEAMGFAFLMGTLWLLHRGRYWWALGPLAALAFTRIITPAVAVVAILHLVGMWRVRTMRPVPLLQACGAASVALLSVVGAFLWKWTAELLGGARTGAVKRPGMSGLQLSWVRDAYDAVGVVGPVLLLVVISLLTAVAVLPMSRWMGLELRTWLAAYPAFVVLATPMTSGIIRYLLLCPPIAFFALSIVPRDYRRTLYAVAALGCIAGLGLQWLYATHAVVLPVQGRVMP